MTNFDIAQFNPRLHPRDRLGRFTEALRGLKPGQSIKLGSVKVTRSASDFDQHRYQARDASGSVIFRHDRADAVTQLADKAAGHPLSRPDGTSVLDVPASHWTSRDEATLRNLRAKEQNEDSPTRKAVLARSAARLEARKPPQNPGTGGKLTQAKVLAAAEAHPGGTFTVTDKAGNKHEGVEIATAIAPSSAGGGWNAFGAFAGVKQKASRGMVWMNQQGKGWKQQPVSAIASLEPEGGTPEPPRNPGVVANVTLPKDELITRPDGTTITSVFVDKHKPREPFTIVVSKGAMAQHLHFAQLPDAEQRFAELTGRKPPSNPGVASRRPEPVPDMRAALLDYLDRWRKGQDPRLPDQRELAKPAAPASHGTIDDEGPHMGGTVFDRPAPQSPSAVAWREIQGAERAVREAENRYLQAQFSGEGDADAAERLWRNARARLEQARRGAVRALRA